MLPGWLTRKRSHQHPASSSLTRDSRTILEHAGERIHLFVDSAEGVRVIYDRGPGSQRALDHLLSRSRQSQRRRR